MGGGSADASFTLKVLDDLFDLNLNNKELEKYALRLGADCPFFIDNTPKLVEGIGEKMTSIDLDLSNYEIRLVNPDIHISTKQAYSGIVPKTPVLPVEKIIELPIIEWKGKLKNDFEESIFEKHLQLESIKDELYKQGSIYSSMSGSGSIVFGIFEK